ncbi:MAG: hypothetical protein CMJ46_15200 [Planctomyces sp.]|nr:hypothetical protein [Planctomyces sp.]
MEIIAILMLVIFELTMTMMTLLIPAMLELVALFVQMILEGLAYLGIDKRKPKETTEAGAEEPTVSSGRLFQTLKRSSKWTAALCGVTLAAMLVVQFFFLPQVLQMFIGPIAEETQIQIAFGDASGNLFTGAIRIERLNLESENEPDKQYDLTIDTLDLNIDYWNSLWYGTRFQSVDISTVRGAFTKIERKRPTEPRHPFLIESFGMQNLQIAFEDRSRGGDPFQSELRIDSFHSEMFESRLVLHDFLFNSQINGTLSGQPFEMQTSGTGTGRETVWTFESMPVKDFSYYLEGPFQNLTSGNLSLDMTSRLSENRERRQLNWDIRLEDVHAEVPPQMPLTTKLVVAPMIALINSIDQDLTLELETELAVADLHGQSAYDGQKLGEALKQAFQEGLSRKLTEEAKTRTENVRSKVIDKLFIPGRNKTKTEQNTNEK